MVFRDFENPNKPNILAYQQIAIYDNNGSTKAYNEHYRLQIKKFIGF
jgi:hypothetical protein